MYPHHTPPFPFGFRLDAVHPFTKQTSRFSRPFFIQEDQKNHKKRNKRRVSTKTSSPPLTAGDANSNTPAPLSPQVNRPLRRSKATAPGGASSAAIASAAGTSGPQGREAQYLRRADALAARGQVEKAIVHLRKAIALVPRSPHGYLKMAALLRRERRAIEAVEVLRAAVRLAPALLAPHEALAETYLETSRWEEAVAEGRLLLQLSPRSLFARDVLSAAYLQQGRIDHALRVTDEMIRLDPADATNHFKRGVLLQQKGMVSPAVSAFGRVLEMNSDPEVADESRAALEMLDGYQIRQILTLAVEDVPFRLRLLQDPCAAIMEKGYLLSEEGLSALSQIGFDDLPQAPAGWRQYRYQ